MSDMPNGEQILPEDDFELLQEARWRSADKRIVRWGILRSEDYYFGDWVDGLSTDERVELPDAGCAYEYARESHKFRCWLVVTERSSFWLKLKGSSTGFTNLSVHG